MKSLSLSVTITAMISIGCLSIGCNSSSDSAAKLPVASGDFLLPSRPEAPASLADTAAKLAEQSGDGEQMVLIGKIDAGDFSAFQDGQATFLLSELPADGHGADDPDHEDNCPFCKRRAEKSPKAIVNLVGDDGATLTTDARELLGVGQGDRVIVVGKGTFDAAVNTITLQCDGVYAGPW